MPSYCSSENCISSDKMERSELFSTLSETSYQQSVTLARERHGRQEHQIEDPRLRNWSRWLKLRLEDQERVRRLTRGPGMFPRALEDLVINSGDDRRPLLEDKHLMEEARYFYEPDRYRGDPAFWKRPWLLSDQCNPCLPACAAPEVIRQPRQFQGVPSAVKPRPGARSALSRWNQIAYRAQRAEELKYELSRMVPHRPDIDSLCVKGCELTLEPMKATHTSPSITVTPPSIGTIPTESEEEIITLDPLKEEEIVEKESTARLLFRGELLERSTKGQQESDHPLQFLLVFEAAVGHIERKNVRVENIGDTVVRFSWVRVGGAGHAAAHFCLESEGGGGPAVFLPGQLYDVRIAFKSRRAGVFREVWCLRTTPQLPKLQLRLWGVCHAPSVSVEAVERYLHRRTTEDAIRRLLLETKERIRLEPPPPLPLSTLCTEREVFLAANAGRGYTYRAEPVAELASLYRRIAPPGTQGCHLDVLHVRDTVLAVLTGQELELQAQSSARGADRLAAGDGRRTWSAASSAPTTAAGDSPGIAGNGEASSGEASSGQLGDVTAQHFSLQEALLRVYQCCEQLREPVPQRTETALGRSMLGAAVHATWAMVAEAVAQEAERLRATWGLPLKPPGHFWQPPVTLPASSRASTKATDKASSTSRQKRPGRQTSPLSSVQPSASQESSLKADVDPVTEQAYLVALYVCTYHHVATAVDWTTATIESHIALSP